MPVEKDGVYYYEESTSLGFGMNGMQYTWLITVDKKLPFLYVTQKEFLERKKQKLIKGKEEVIASVKDSYKIRTKAEQEAEKKRILDKYAKDGSAGERYVKNYLAAYKTDEEILKDNMQKRTQGFDDALAAIEIDLKKSPAELSQVAIVKQNPKNVIAHLFTNADDQFAHILIKPNPGYFNTKLPRSAPQFISVMIRGNDKDPAMGKAIKDIAQAIDLKKLKAMLEK
jgi:hypothetical protein